MPYSVSNGHRVAAHTSVTKPQIENSRFPRQVLHMITHNSNSVSYLCRDLEDDKWRRVTVARSHQFSTAMDEYEKGAEARRRLGEKQAERQGFCLKVFSVAGPNGVYISLVYPLNSHEVDLRFCAPYDEAYFMHQLMQWESLE
ncbi:hypothetical protein NEUTE2DRAFT_94388 [Neurospora tetrasperma FGSC 2509]|nr:hypothetical protein NEUTE2DRAFT_94388 [Neurospora tetrasperma FGSC 2509]